jgi:hypothetical protein
MIDTFFGEESNQLNMADPSGILPFIHPDLHTTLKYQHVTDRLQIVTQLVLVMSHSTLSSSTALAAAIKRNGQVLVRQSSAGNCGPLISLAC